MIICIRTAEDNELFPGLLTCRAHIDLAEAGTTQFETHNAQYIITRRARTVVLKPMC
jgi:hypothetical protein